MDCMDDKRLNPERTALVVIDMQKGIARIGREIMPYSIEAVIGNVSRLAEKFRRSGAQLFLVHVLSHDGKDALRPLADNTMKWNTADMPADYAEFIDALKQAKEDIIITKRQWGAFYGTEMDLQLRRRHIDTLVLCGISTNIGVETTAREAYQHGYNQLFAIDAMGAMTKEEHDATQRFIFPRIGLVRTTDEILGMLGEDS